MHTAEYWHKQDEGGVACELCPHHCTIAEGRTGLCGVRRVTGGVLHAIGYGLLSSAHADPIEKKPLYHFQPGRLIMSIGGWGCNFACEFCQNWSLSQQVVERGDRYAADRIAEQAGLDGSVGIAYTYNEPLINFEFVRDCAACVKDNGLANVLVTNGHIEPAPAAELLPLIDALNIDVKSMDPQFYKDRCRGQLAPVLRFAEQARRAGCHVEITNLVIPGLNDADRRIEELAGWIAEQLGAETPLHLSAYHPQYKMRVRHTPVETLRHARELASTRLSYVYLGNVLSADGQDTACPQCGNTLVSRHGFSARLAGLKDKRCADCGRPADFVLG